MNILFLNKFFYLKGGAERVYFEEMNVLRRHGHKCIPFSRRSTHDVESEYSGFFAPNLSLTRKLSYQSIKNSIEIIYSFSAKTHLHNLLSRHKVDIAHGHNIYGLLTTSVLDELHKNGIPAVLTLHDYKIICPNYQFLNRNQICEECRPHRYYNAVLNRCVHEDTMSSTIYALENYFHYLMGCYRKKVAQFIAVSRFIKNKFIEYGYPEDKIKYIPNFINTEQYMPTYEDEEYFLYSGRLVPEKGIRTLIKAFLSLRTSKHKLVIVGDGPLKQSLEVELLKTGTRNIEITGFLTGEALADKIRKCTCTIIPSEIYENCPMSVLEALAFGKPVIGANIGGIPELIKDKVDGFIFESGSAFDLADKMNHIASLTSSQIKQMGRAGRAKVELHYNADRHYESLISLYQSLLR
jgi:glycosyltransferase involved in cell wall biosynthesis